MRRRFQVMHAPSVSSPAQAPKVHDPSKRMMHIEKAHGLANVDGDGLRGFIVMELFGNLNGKWFVFCLASRRLGSAAHKARRRSKGIGDVVKRGEPGKAQLAEPIASLLIILIIAAKYLETFFFAAKNVQGYAADYVYAEQRRGYTASKN